MVNNRLFMTVEEAILVHKRSEPQDINPRSGQIRSMVSKLNAFACFI
jgi:hypothetical protein